MLLLERWITEVGHVTPTEYFVRPEWDPLGIAGPPTGSAVGDLTAGIARMPCRDAGIAIGKGPTLT